jgi:hypothetical protein
MWLIEVGVAPENSRWGKRGMGVALLTISPIEDTGEAGFEEISTSSSMWLSWGLGPSLDPPTLSISDNDEETNMLKDFWEGVAQLRQEDNYTSL